MNPSPTRKGNCCRNAPPCRAPVATTPVLRPTRPPQQRELQCLRFAGLILSTHPPSPRPDISSPSPSRLLDLTLASSQVWPGIHSKVTDHIPVHYFGCLWGTQLTFQWGHELSASKECSPLVLSSPACLLCWCPEWHFLSLSLSLSFVIFF